MRATNNDIYKEYEAARDKFYIKKKWLKDNEEALKKEYEGSVIPCDGLVKTRDDTKKAVNYYRAFRKKLEYENKLSDEAKISFDRTIEKYRKVGLLMKTWEWLKQKFTTVYCEDCEHCIPEPEPGTIFSSRSKIKGRCKMHPIKPHRNIRPDYFKKPGQEEIREVDYKDCGSIRRYKTMPPMFSPRCFEFQPKKPLTSESNMV